MIKPVKIVEQDCILTLRIRHLSFLCILTMMLVCLMYKIGYYKEIERFANAKDTSSTELH